MKGMRVRDYCQMIQTEVVEGLTQMSGASLRRVTLRLALDAAPGPGGGLEVLRVVPESSLEATIAGSVQSWVTLELEMGCEAKNSQAVPSEAVLQERHGVAMVEAVPLGGDQATLRRRLELVLGGPPGFTTGAKAEMLSDLLREFGSAKVMEAISKDWVTQFDTGIEASSSVG